jgi:hypothetical protein
MEVNDSFNGLVRGLREDILVGLLCSDSKSLSGEPGSVVDLESLSPDTTFQAVSDPDSQICWTAARLDFTVL